jgi:hypothetical protein
MQLASLFDLVSERLSMLEDKVKQQDSLIMELTYQLEKAEGKTMPYISGRFGYGVGRTASHREVLLFAKQAQTGKERAKWPTSFLGKYKTDGNGMRLLHCTFYLVHRAILRFAYRGFNVM